MTQYECTTPKSDQTRVTACGRCDACFSAKSVCYRLWRSGIGRTAISIATEASAITGRPVGTFMRAIYDFGIKGEPKRSQPPGGHGCDLNRRVMREREIDNGKPCEKCGLRGEHECMPDSAADLALIGSTMIAFGGAVAD